MGQNITFSSAPLLSHPFPSALDHFREKFQTSSRESDDMLADAYSILLYLFYSMLLPGAGSVPVLPLGWQ